MNLRQRRQRVEEAAGVVAVTGFVPGEGLAKSLLQKEHWKERQSTAAEDRSGGRR